MFSAWVALLDSWPSFSASETAAKQYCSNKSATLGLSYHNNTPRRHCRTSGWRMQCLSSTGNICLTRLSYSSVIIVSESKSEIRGGDGLWCFRDIVPKLALVAKEMKCPLQTEPEPAMHTWTRTQPKRESQARARAQPNSWVMGDAKNPAQKHVT
jgi:hypothetical protein